MQPLRVVVLGGLNMDLIVRVPNLPRRGETVTGEDLLRAPGGKGGNQAVAAARLGASVTMIGQVGRDAFGRELTQRLRETGVATRWVHVSNQPTGAALIFVDERGENSIAVAPGANLAVEPDDVPPRVVAGADVLIAALEVPLASIERAFRIARGSHVRTVLNAAPAQALPESLLQLCDVVIVNEVELAAVVGRRGDELSLARNLRAFASQLVVVTLGDRGAFAIDGERTVSQAAFKVSVVDTVGAGDAFVAGFVIGFADSLEEGLRVGCAAGGLATTVRGAQPSMPSLADVRALLDAN